MLTHRIEAIEPALKSVTRKATDFGDEARNSFFLDHYLLVVLLVRGKSSN